MENAPDQYQKSIIEALLFISEKPVMIEQFREVMDNIQAAEVKKLVKDLMNEYEDQRRGMTIVEIAGGYQMLSSSHYASFVRKFFKTRVKEKLTRPSLEALAIVAYKQPVSRADIELVRGVNSDGVVNHLLSKGLVKIVGRKNVPGRPYIYGTTKLFLEYFGLKSLRDLPKLEDIQILDIGTEEQDILPAEEGAEEAALAAAKTEPAEAGQSPESAEADTADESTAETTEDSSGDEAPEEPEGTGEIQEEDPEELKHAMEEIGREDRAHGDDPVDGVEEDPEPAQEPEQENEMNTDQSAGDEPAAMAEENRTA